MIKNKCVLKLRNRFQVYKDLSDEAETENTWTSIKDKFLTTAQEILGKRKQKKD